MIDNCQRILRLSSFNFLHHKQPSTHELGPFPIQNASQDGVEETIANMEILGSETMDSINQAIDKLGDCENGTLVSAGLVQTTAAAIGRALHHLGVLANGNSSTLDAEEKDALDAAAAVTLSTEEPPYLLELRNEDVAMQDAWQLQQEITADNVQAYIDAGFRTMDRRQLGIVPIVSVDAAQESIPPTEPEVDQESVLTPTEPEVDQETVLTPTGPEVENPPAEPTPKAKAKAKAKAKGAPKGKAKAKSSPKAKANASKGKKPKSSPKRRACAKSKTKQAVPQSKDTAKSKAKVKSGDSDTKTAKTDDDVCLAKKLHSAT